MIAMRRRRLVPWSIAFLGLIFPGISGKPLGTGGALAESPGPRNQAVLPNLPDIAKGVIEKNTKTVVASRSLGAPAASNFVNPKVGPGRVRWHASFGAACEAAGKSGKPVLLFQIRGKPDEQFC